MIELSESEALAKGTYAELVNEPLQHYRLYIRRKLVTVIYPGHDDPFTARAFHLSHYQDVPFEIHTPVDRLENGVRWRTWYMNPDGTIEKILEPEFDEAGNYLKESYLGPDGELRSYSDYHYDEDGSLTEIVTYNPDGSVSHREEAD